jgi:arylsulfatase A
MGRTALLFATLVCQLAVSAFALSAFAASPPNVVLIFCDDMGYGDPGCFGSKNPTPNIDRMAKEGIRFTNFYVAQPICSASRAALMTGCYSNRVGILGALPPGSKVGISDREWTMAQMFKSRGYATAIFGKWHLGDAPQFLPTRHGFDEYFGLPYSNDMRPQTSPKFPPLPLFDGEKVIQTNPDLSTLTTLYTEKAVSFIDRHKDGPFFLYVPHAMPHVPLAVSDKFAGKTGLGLYGDVMAEIDWSVGEILGALKRNGLDDRTLVIFLSDNGPWLLFGDHAGSAGPLREGKTTTFEGGVREPCIMRWPGKIPAGVQTTKWAASFDLLPTFAALAAATLPGDRVIDGMDIRPLIFNEAGAQTPHDAFYYYSGRKLLGVRSGKWKLTFPHEYNHPDPPGRGGKGGQYSHPHIDLSLYDLESDPGETRNVIADHPDVVTRLQALAEKARDDLGDAAMNRPGKNVREPGHLRDSAAAPSPAAQPADAPSSASPPAPADAPVKGAATAPVPQD